MDSAKHICLWNRRLNREEINRAIGSMVLGITPSDPTPIVALPNDTQDRSCNNTVDCIYESEIPVDLIPEAGTIVKMSEQKWVDDFFDTGALKLGSVSEFQKHEHPEIGDENEGISVVVALYPNCTFSYELDHPRGTIFCTYAGEVDQECMDRFGYDSGFEIVDPYGFAKAIASTIEAEKFDFSSCVYSNDKVLVSEKPEPLDLSCVSFNDLIRVGGHTRAFIKPEKYSNQSEFRFLWLNPKKPSSFIVCKEAVQFCKRIET